jgi:RNA polymerase sigma factor for flagellar operon FliA
VALQNELSRIPTDAELAERLGMPVEEMNRIMGEMQGFMVLSYEELLQDNLAGERTQYCAALGGPEQSLQADELKTIIAQSIDELNEKERTVVSLYYFEELKIKEIAFVMGLTESRISQLHTKALLKLRCRIGEYLKE